MNLTNQKSSKYNLATHRSSLEEKKKSVKHKSFATPVVQRFKTFELSLLLHIETTTKSEESGSDVIRMSTFTRIVRFFSNYAQTRGNLSMVQHLRTLLTIYLIILRRLCGWRETRINFSSMIDITAQQMVAHAQGASGANFGGEIGELEFQGGFTPRVTGLQRTGTPTRTLPWKSLASSFKSTLQMLSSWRVYSLTNWYARYSRETKVFVLPLSLLNLWRCWIPCNGVKSLFLVTIVVVYDVGGYRMNYAKLSS